MRGRASARLQMNDLIVLLDNLA